MVRRLMPSELDLLRSTPVVEARQVFSQIPLMTDRFRRRRWVLSLECGHQSVVSEPFDELPVSVICLECTEAALTAADSPATAPLERPSNETRK